MRLYKKAAAVLLAAAMAVSMMTACGGGAGGGNGGNGGNAGAVPSAPTLEEIVLPKDDGEGEGTPTKTHLDKANSWLVAFQNNVVNAHAVYFAGSQSSYSAAGTQTEELKMVMASTAGKAYVDMTGWGLEGSKKEDHAITFYMESGKASAVYALNKSAKAGIKMNLSADDMEGITGDFDFSDIQIPANIYLTEVQIGGTKYRAETYVQDGNEYYTCFGTDKRPKYQITKKQNGGTDVSAYQEIVIGSDKGMCNLTGYTIYTAGEDAQHNLLLSDENKNVFSVVIERDTNGKLTKMTVKDATGKDVTKDFNWLAEILGSFYGN